MAAPAMVPGDDLAQMSVNYSHARITDDVYGDGTWRSRQTSDFTETWSLEGAHIFHDRFQAGAAVAVVRREKQERSASGLGDITGSLGYEYLPDWDYNPYRPKGLGFVQLSVPAGKSIHEVNDPIDARGRGFWALGAGTLLTKTWGRWDALTLVHVRHSFDKSYSRGGTATTLRPGRGGAISVGGGFSLSAWRLGGTLGWNYEDPIRARGEISSQGAVQRFGSVNLLLSYLFDKNWSGTIGYLDQTWIGAPLNANLQRAVQLQLQYKMAR